MKDLTKYFINLKKCSEEQRKHIFSLLPEPNWEFENQHDITENHFKLHISGNSWWVLNNYEVKDKTELTYPEFIKLFDGGESEGWIKIESEEDLPKDEKFWICTSDDRVLISSKTVLNWILKNENNKITHYQPIIKPLPPKF